MIVFFLFSLPLLFSTQTHQVKVTQLPALSVTESNNNLFLLFPNPFLKSPTHLSQNLGPLPPRSLRLHIPLPTRNAFPRTTRRIVLLRPESPIPRQRQSPRDKRGNPRAGSALFEKIRNTCIWIDEEGEIVQRYQKLHLFDMDNENGPTARESEYVSINPCSLSIVMFPTLT
jgi:hypothetical protein